MQVGSGKYLAFSELLRNAYLPGSRFTRKLVVGQAPRQELVEGRAETVRIISILPGWRVWRVVWEASLPRATIWAEPIVSRIGRHLAVWLLAQRRGFHSERAVLRRLHAEENDEGR